MHEFLDEAVYNIFMLHPLRRVYFISFVFTLNIALTAYMNSTFLAGFFSESRVGLLFSAAALLTILALELLPLSIENFGVKKTAGLVLASSMVSLLVLANADSALSAGIFFVLYTLSNSLVVFCLDICIAHFSKKTDAGDARGTYLTTTNLGWLASPFLAGAIVSGFGYSTLYSLVAGVVTLALVIFLYLLRQYEDAEYIHRSPLVALGQLKKAPDLIRILVVSFLIQFFFSWMVIFAPFYLHEVVGIPFEKLGGIFTIMLLPFVLLPLKLGRIADRKLGEKEILITAIFIISIATFIFASYGGTSALMFGIILFFTRVGAASIESMCETYFFKKVSDEEPDVVSLFRMMAPLAYMIGPLVATLLLAHISHNGLFYALGAIMLLCLIPAVKLTDTR